MRFSLSCLVVAAAVMLSGCHAHVPAPPPPPANLPPTVVTTCDPCVVVLGREATVTAAANDPDGDTLIFRWTAPAGALATPDNRQTLWTAPSRPGDIPITVTVDDGKGGTASAAVTIRVVAPPAAAAPAPPPPSPRFPWPPPRWTARTDLSLSLVQQQTTDTNQTILDRINSAFGNANYPDWSVYPLSDGGFAVVAQMETIDDTGRRLPGQEAWLEDPPWTLADGFGAILRRLFSADHGHYRIVVILLTTLEVVSSAETPSDAIRALPTVGSHTLPGTVASAVPMPSARLYALIYEFKKASGESARWLSAAESGIDAKAHLALAGLWKLPGQ